MLPMSVVGEIEANGGVTIPDWALNWVHGVYNCYRFSGDRDAVKALMPSGRAGAALVCALPDTAAAC